MKTTPADNMKFGLFQLAPDQERPSRLKPMRERRWLTREAACGTNCVDCGVGTLTLREWYMVKDDVWELAWAGRRKSWYKDVPDCTLGVEVLCIGCLEKRIGRKLTACDFTDALVNDLRLGNNSARLRERLLDKQRS